MQQQAIRDFGQAMAHFFAGTHRRPTWRKDGRHEGFRVIAVKPGDVRRLSRRVGEVRVPKAGWVRFRWSRAVSEAKSYRVTRDRAGRWHIAFAAVPPPIPAPGNRKTVGVDRGVAVSAALSTGELLTCPLASKAETGRLARLQRRLAKAKRGSNRRAKLKVRIARIKARQADRRKDWVEKTSTSLASRFDRIAFEQLQITAMTKSAKGTLQAPGTRVGQKTGLNRSILQHAWGGLLRRTIDKAPGRVVVVPAAYTSQRCSRCGHTAGENRKSQAVFACRACGHTVHADVNAGINIDTAAGHAVVLREEGTQVTGPMNREPQPELLPCGESRVGISSLQQGEDVKKISLSAGGVPPPPASGPHDTDLHAFAVRLRRMNAEFNRIAQELARANGLHHTDVQALVAILDGDGHGGALTPGRLREHLNLTSGAVSACLNRLEAAGHIQRVRDPGDGRVVHLHYAAAGRAVARDYFRPLAESTDAARRHFDEDELRTVLRFLDAMGDELSAVRRPPTGR